MSELPSETVPQRALRGLEVYADLEHPHGRAAAAGVGKNAVEKMAAALRRDPSIRRRVISGELDTMAKVQLAAGLPGYLNKVDRALGEGSPKFGKGDKFHEATMPLRRYLNAWETREYRFTHLNPGEAGRRHDILEVLKQQIEAAQADLEKRSQRATLSLSRRKGSR